MTNVDTAVFRFLLAAATSLVTGGVDSSNSDVIVPYGDSDWDTSYSGVNEFINPRSAGTSVQSPTFHIRTRLIVLTVMVVSLLRWL